MSILPKKEVLLPCMLRGKQRQQDSAICRKPVFLIPVRQFYRYLSGALGVRLPSRRWGNSQSVCEMDGVPGARSVLGANLRLVPSLSKPLSRPIGSLKPAMVGGFPPPKSASAGSQIFFLPFGELVVKHFQHTIIYSLLEARGETKNEQWVCGWVTWWLYYEDEQNMAGDRWSDGLECPNYCTFCLFGAWVDNI